MTSRHTFLYFAYGSNLLAERIHINNPSARFKNVAKLDQHQLDFNYFSQRWQGAAATILPTPGAEVWGVLWELDAEHQETLDSQEGVPHVYNRKQVEVECEDGSRHRAVTYFLIKPEEEDKRPSAVYKESLTFTAAIAHHVNQDVIVRGAVEHGLPPHYVSMLRAVEDNGYSGEVSVKVDLRQISKIPDEKVKIRSFDMNTRRRSTSFSPPVKNSSIVSETQLKVLEKHFERGQFVDANSAEKLSKDLKMPVKQIKAWFTKMRRKSKCFKKTATSDKEMYSIHGSDALYAVKQPRVPVLVDMGTLKAIKNSIESCEIVLDGDDEEDENIRSINDIDENVDISTLNTSTLLKVNASMAEIASQMVIEEDNTPLIKQCTTTNGYIETLLERIEQLEDSIKEKEGEVYFMKKDMDKVQETLDSKEAVLNTIQKSIPKVVSDHKKALQDKDAEILKWKTKSDEIKMELDKLQEKYQVDPEGNGDRTEEVEQLVSTIAEKDRLIEDLRGCNVKQQTDDQQPSSYDLTDLREKVSVLETDVSLKADELHVLKFKLRQHENSWRVTRDLEERLESSKQQVAVLQEKNDVSSQKIADLELDVFSKSAEIRSLSDIVTRLNTKLKESNQSNHAMDLSGCAKDESVATEVDHPLDISSRGSEDSSLSFNHSVVEELFSDILNTF